MSRPMLARLLRSALPALSLAILLGAIFYLQPRTMSYFGLNLLLNLAVPIALATLAQMCVLTVNDLDLSIGSYVSLTACITATWLNDTPILGVAALLACILAYGAVGALVHLRNLPSIVVTLGLSFVWLGLAILILPTPGGKAPGWIRELMTLKPAYVPFPVIACVVIALVVHVVLMRSPYGAVLRGAGGNPRAVARAGWSLLRVKVTMYMAAGTFGALAGIALVGLTTSADANIALRYTLLSIAGAILGGSEFVGGRVSPIGAVIGAVTLTLAASFLSFLRLNPDFQIGAQGAILILVLALRAVIGRTEADR
ncbi:ABC transporter permease [Acuticoccus sp. M5D2P5]|uniref:ABC transporter permease n=1 Tax=Acuticoccus kalidii TaxID=2910977 RepID=UPI001F190E4A|nr:ABC transporter permease [Acuticoccus kalidii]MCF3934238.1 ABC transporter permease [Acuticoccus kalidii]